jgi:hypothetical protein
MRIVTAILLTGTLGCVHHIGSAEPAAAPTPTAPTTPKVKDAANARYIVKTPPPEAYVESQPPSARATDVWVPGYFKWDGRDYDWVPGRWATPPDHTHDWVPGEWSERSDGRWQFVDGHWE